MNDRIRPPKIEFESLDNLNIKKEDLLNFIEDYAKARRLSKYTYRTYLDVVKFVHLEDNINKNRIRALNENNREYVRLYQIIIKHYIRLKLKTLPFLYSDFIQIKKDLKLHNIDSLYDLIYKTSVYLNNFKFRDERRKELTNIIFYTKFYTGARTSTFCKDYIKMVEKMKINIGGVSTDSYYHYVRIKRSPVAFFSPIDMRELNITEDDVRDFDVFYSRMKVRLGIRQVSDTEEDKNYLQDPIRKAYMALMFQEVRMDWDMFDYIVLGHSEKKIYKNYLEQVYVFRENAKYLYESYVFTKEYLTAAYLSVPSFLRIVK